MSGHTPGPWWTDGQYDGKEMGCAIVAAHTDRGPLPGNPTRGMVAFATELINTRARQCEANARLIAAAPSLLEALKLAEDVLSRFPYSTEMWPNGTHPQTGIVQIRAAINAAEGRDK